MKHFAFSFSLCLLALCPTGAHAFELASTPDASLTPHREVKASADGVLVNYDFPGAFISEDNLYPGTFHVSIPGFGHSMTPSLPEYPVRWDSFVIPEGMDADVALTDISQVAKDFHLAPAREDLSNSGNDFYSLDNVPPIAPFAGFIPSQNVLKGNMKVFRDRNILYVGVMPVSYSLEEGKTVMAESLSYTVSFKISSSRAKASKKNRHTVDDNDMGRMFTYSGESSEMLRAFGTGTNPSSYYLTEAPHYLILSVPAYREAVERFADWKRVMGFNVDVVYNSRWTPHLIKSTVEKNYNDQPRLEYLLLFGDEVDLPG